MFSSVMAIFYKVFPFLMIKYKNTNRMSCDCRRLHVLTLVRNFESSVGKAYGEMLTLILPSQLTYRG